MAIICFVAAQYIPPLAQHKLWFAASVSVFGGVLKELGDYLEVLTENHEQKRELESSLAYEAHDWQRDETMEFGMLLSREYFS